MSWLVAAPSTDSLSLKCFSPTFLTGMEPSSLPDLISLTIGRLPWLTMLSAELTPQLWNKPTPLTPPLRTTTDGRARVSAATSANTNITFSAASTYEYEVCRQFYWCWWCWDTNDWKRVDKWILMNWTRITSFFYIKYYNNPTTSTQEELEEDMKRFKYMLKDGWRNTTMEVKSPFIFYWITSLLYSIAGMTQRSSLSSIS